MSAGQFGLPVAWRLIDLSEVVPWYIANRRCLIAGLQLTADSGHPHTGAMTSPQPSSIAYGVTQSLLLVVALCCFASSGFVCSEAYGDGPPYYGRTTNMDKWSSPMLQLVILSGVGLAALVVAAVRWRRHWCSRG